MLFLFCPFFNDDIYNVGQNILNKVKKSSKIGQEQKTLIAVLAKFLATIIKVFFLEGRLGTKLSPPNFKTFLISPYFLRF